MNNDMGAPMGMPPEKPKKNNTVLIVIIVLVVLCCCLAIFSFAAWNYGDQVMHALGLN